MKKFCIITNSSKDNNYELSNRIKDYLLGKGAECIIDTTENDNDNYRYTNPDNVPDDTECIITIGGDGTLLQAAHDLINKDVVFLGINKGNLGFLAETGSDNISETLDRLLNDEIKIENRMMLKGSVQRKGNTIYESVALNDIVIHRNGGIRVSDYKVSVNDLYLNEYHADGIIISTPTGSTAYNLSAGGPIVEPNARLMVLTPICAHSINGRSIIFSAKDSISVEICPSRNQRDDNSMVAFDGYSPLELLEDDIVIIEQSELCTKLAKLDDSSFLQVLKDKMGDE